MERIVIKIGTNVLSNPNGTLNMHRIRDFVSQITEVKKSGKEVIVVTSGAIGAGMGALGITRKVRDIPTRQACAAIGQGILMKHYMHYFDKYKIKIAQILVTYLTFSNRKTYLNLENTLNKLLRMGVVPILNENDPIAIDEIGASFGDNDKLSALVASNMNANKLIILSDIDGLHCRDPKKHKDAQLIREVNNITDDIEHMCGRPGSRGTGGMKTKIEAAKICSDAGVTLIIANGNKECTIQKIVSGQSIGTVFVPLRRIEHKKRWIALAVSKGRIIVDNGAMEALQHGKNLLPAGVRDVEGIFSSGDVVDIICNGTRFAKIITDYSSEQLKAVKGSKARNVMKHENIVFI